jgi:general secretion pathway protein H
VRTRTSPAGRAPRAIAGERGFTLLELLVVLAIIGVMLVVIPGFMLRGQPGLDVDVAARAIADALRMARGEAMQTNREQLFALDVEERVFRTGQDRPPVQMDRAIEVTFQTVRQEQVSEAIGQIRFFPDGSSTGGRIGLSRNDRHATVAVDWLTGLVSIDDAAE